MTDLLSTDPAGPVVMLATPAYGGIQPLHELAIVETMRDLARRGYRTIRQHSVGNPILPYARANLLGAFWRSRADWMLMVDGDIGFPGEMVGDMIGWSDKRWQRSKLLPSQYMLAAVAPMRDYAVDRVLATGNAMDGISWAMTPGVDHLADVHELSSKGLIDMDKEGVLDGFVTRQCVGTGFVLAHQSAISRLIVAHPELRYEEDGRETWSLFHPFLHGGKAVPEDVAFFDRWRLLDGAIWVKLDAPMTHTGPMTVGANLRDVLLGGKSPAVSSSDAKVMAWRRGEL